MNITRRSLVIGLPAAASGLLVACGADSGTPEAASSGLSEKAAAAAASVEGAISGQLSITADSGSFPSYLTALLPSATLTQACMNSCTKDYIDGKTADNLPTALTEVFTEVNIDICHATAQGVSRSVSMALRKKGIWANGQEVTFTAYNEAAYAAAVPPKAPPSESLTGMTSHLQDPGASNQATERYFHRFVSGKVKARKSTDGQFLQLTFLGAADALTATKAASTSANKGSTTGTVRIMHTSARPSQITLRLITEDEASV